MKNSVSTTLKLLSIAAGFLLSTCSSEPVETGNKQYIFIGHTYDWLAPDRLDPRLYHLDFEQFNGIWLGGDICSKTSDVPTALPHIDSLFDLSAESTLWTLGNHDLGSQTNDSIQSRTKRPSFYTKNIDNLCLVVLNTNLFWHQTWQPPQENCELKNAQVDFLKNILDTLAFPSHLVILHHHSLLNELKTTSSGEFLESGNVNARPVRLNCDSTSSFTTTFLPLLQEIRNRNIQVVLAGGDYGMQSKAFEFRSPEGLVLLGSGINNSMNMDYPASYVSNFNPDSVLIFSNNSEQNLLTWSFVQLSELVQQHNSNKPNYSNRVQDLLDEY